MKQQTKTTLVKTGVGIACLAAIVMCGLFLYDNSRIFYYCAISLLGVAAVAFGAVDGEKYPHVSRTLLVIAVVLAFVTMGYVVLELTGLTSKFTDFDAIRQFILDSGFWGATVFIAITVFQVVVLPIPEAVTILLGVAIYGATWSFILSVIGTLIGSLISFLLGKVFGRRLCNWMFGAENTEKYAKLLGEKGRFLFIIMLLFPAFPDDMLCMIAGITSMSYAYFTVICLLTRPVMIGITAYLGSGAIPFSGRGIAVWIGIGCVMVVLFIVVGRIKNAIENRAAAGGGIRRRRRQKGAGVKK